jgi:uncharacterized protein (DUF2252 family)
MLGERMLADSFLGKSVVVREVMPQDLKLDMDQMTREQVVSAARYLAAVVGNVHARQMTPGVRREWVAELRKKPLEESGCSWVDALRRSPWKHVRIVSISMLCARPISRARWSGSRR